METLPITTPSTNPVPTRTFTSYTDYANRFQAAEQKEDWSEAITLCQTALHQISLSLTEKTTIEANIVSPLFYKKNYQTALTYGLSALETAKEAPSHNSIARAYYLISAAYRGLWRITDEIDTKTSHKVSAKENIEHAIDYLAHHSVEKQIKAKIHFNAGAYFQDIEKDLTQATQHFQESINTYTDIQDYNNTTRVYLRIGRIEIDRNNHNAINEIMQTIDTYLRDGKLEQNSKTHVHYNLFKVKHLTSKMDHDSAHQLITETRQIAEQKGMLMEVEELDKIIQNLSN